MRVVVVADFSYPNFLGGSARYVYDLVKGFEQNNIDYLLITRKHKGEYSLEEDDSFYNQVSSQGKVFEIEGVASYIKSFFLLKKSDLILSHHQMKILKFYRKDFSFFLAKTPLVYFLVSHKQCRNLLHTYLKNQQS